MVCILKTIGLWIAMLLIEQTLLGCVLRGMKWKPPEIENSSDRVEQLIKKESSKLSRSNHIMTFLFIILYFTTCYFINYIWDIHVLLCFILMTLFSFPDLHWKIKTGTTPTPKTMPKGVFHILSSIFLFLTIPLLWYFICYKI